MNISMLNDEQYKLYSEAENQVSDEHPYKCVCGRLCTGLHERNCKQFRKLVERRYNMFLKKMNKGE